MSWHVHGHGRYYHSWREYQAALRAYEENSAARQLERRANELRGKLNDLRKQLLGSAGQLQREQELQRQFAAEARDLERTADRLQRSHQEDLGRLDSEMSYLANTLDQTQHDLSDVRRNFDAYRRDFDARYQQLHQGILAELETVRAEKTELDRRLETQRRAVAEEFERKRRNRLDQEKDQARRAQIALDLANETLLNVRAQAEKLQHDHLQRRIAEVGRQISLARELARSGNTTAGLLAASTVQTEALTLEENASEARSRLQLDRERATQLAARSQNLISDARVTKYLPLKVKPLFTELRVAETQINKVFETYDRYSQEYPQLLSMLEKIETEAERMHSAAPVAELQCAERKEKIRNAVAQIEQRLGQSVKKTPRLLNPADPLSPIEVIVEFNGEKLRLTFHADREMEICAYQHAHDYDCEKSMNAALALVQDLMKVRHHAQDYAAFGHAPPPQVSVPEPPRTVEELSRQPRIL
jgi:chromosome segregation ATPase